jgi:gamma-glutamylcyclotransferase (GGCT)/AIG2-like uncharacterized protein YtfP
LLAAICSRQGVDAGSPWLNCGLPTVNCQLLFVYGTLKRGFKRHRFLQAARAQFLCRGSVRGRLFDLGHYPGVLPSDHPCDVVLGEVYRLPNPALALRVLDAMEGCAATSDAGEYRRELARVTLDHGKAAEAWVYWLNRQAGPQRRITNGDYRHSSR